MGITFASADGARRYGFQFDVTPGVPALVGMVLGTGTDHDVRVMSDVWSDRLYAQVWDADARTVRRVTLGYVGFTGYLPCEVDATPEVVAASAAWEQAEAARYASEQAAREAAEAAERARQAEEDARVSILRRIDKGDRVVVARGRKVPVGTVGVVTWVGEDSYGKLRIGLRDDEGTVHWTAMDNVDRENKAELACIAAACGSWTAMAEARRAEAACIAAAERAAAEARAKQTGVARNAAVITPCGQRGIVFWLSGDGRRCGVRVGKSRDAVVWADCDKVSVASAASGKVAA